MSLRLKTAITLLAVALAGLLPTARIRAHSDAPNPLWGPYTTRTTETGTVINWKTEASTWGVVQYAAAEQHASHGDYEGFAVDLMSRQLHQLRLTGLQPAQEYHYRIWILGSDVSQDSFPTESASGVEDWLRDHGTATRDCSFRTLGDQSFTFVVYGDTQEQYPWFTQMERHKLVADYIAREEGISFVVHLGDFTYDADDLGGWDVFFEAGKEMLADNTIYPVMGNHEDYSPAYGEIFGVPEYYAFQSGEARFVVLDTNSRADFEAQRRWLEDQLRSPSTWNFAFYHHPAYSSDSRNYGGWELSRRHWEDIFRDAGVSAVFSGHVHAYEHYLVRGMNHFVVGTGGGLLSELHPDPPTGNKDRLAKTLGYAKVTVDSDAVTIHFLKVARISEDNREVLQVYPFGSVYDTVTLDPGEAQIPLESSEPHFRVSPPSLRITVHRDGSSRFNVRMTSSEDAQVFVDTEDLPFEVRPTTLQIQGSGQPQTFELELFANRASPNGEYEGKLTLLRDAGDNVALGVKVKTTVLQTGEGSGILGVISETDIVLLIAVFFVIAANIGAYVAYRRYKARCARTKEV